MRKAYKKLDSRIVKQMRKKGDTSGATAVTVAVVDDTYNALFSFASRCLDVILKNPLIAHFFSFGPWYLLNFITNFFLRNTASSFLFRRTFSV